MITPDKIITSAANPVIKQMTTLNAKKYRDADGLFMVEGLRDVADAVHHGFQLRQLAYDTNILNDAAFQTFRRTCPATTQIYAVPHKILQRITDRDNAQSVVGIFEQKILTLDHVKDGLWVGLENIRDPGNLGTIIRTVDAVGARGVILIGTTCDPWSPDVIHATMGSFSHVGITHSTLDDFLSWRTRFHGKLIGTHLQTSTDYRQLTYDQPLILLMGSEQAGLSPSLTAACDNLVKIPMAGKTESLNLAVSTGVLLYEACRTRLTLA